MSEKTAAPATAAPRTGPKTPVDIATERLDEAQARVDELAPSCEGVTIAEAHATGNQKLVRMVQGYGDAKRAAVNAAAVLAAETAAAEAK